MKNSLITFTSSNRVGIVNADGSAERYLEFSVPGQARWATGPQFQDGRRILVTSYADVTISRLVTGEVSTRTWIYDLVSGALEEVLTRDIKAPFTYCHTLLPGETRVAANAVIQGEERIFTMDLDGGNSHEVTTTGEGFSYCVALNPAGDRFSFHVTASKLAHAGQAPWFQPGHYSINTLGVDGFNRVLVAGSPGHLYFGPRWSPQGDWLVYLDCHSAVDPAHFWANICIGRPDGSEHRVVTTGQNHWFGTTFGTREKRSGGSNIPSWTPDGKKVTYTRAVPGSHPDCEYHPELPDHCECVFSPEQARGGSQICLLDPFNGQVEEITAFEEHRWDFRAAVSPDGESLVFTRARLGQPGELWAINLDGSGEHLLSRGIDGAGADHGRWLAG
jgi:Tol biopolymer transport system component